MTEQVSRNHHVVPQFFLRGFSAGRALWEHRRDGSATQVTVKDAAARWDFYRTDSGNAPTTDALEDWLGRQIEGPSAESVKALRRGVIPAEPDRGSLAGFVAFQMLRGPAFRRRLRGISEHLAPVLWSQAVVSEVLQKEKDWRPDDETLHHMLAVAARHVPNDFGHPGTDADHRTMMREAARLKQLLAPMHWTVCRAQGPLLLVGDCPAVVRDALGEEHPNVVTLPERFEVLMPLTPSCLLVISPFVPLGSASAVLTSTFADEVNAASVRACETSVFRHPRMSFPSDLVMPAEPPAMERPQVTVSLSNPGDEQTELKWPVMIERAFTEAMQMLGGDPDLA